jgi:hypothetical protein
VLTYPLTWPQTFAAKPTDHCQLNCVGTSVQELHLSEESTAPVRVCASCAAMVKKVFHGYREVVSKSTVHAVRVKNAEAFCDTCKEWTSEWCVLEGSPLRVRCPKCEKETLEFDWKYFRQISSTPTQ